jgi:pimeloyl-ACP methyl ester carboxylesterase
MLQDPMTHRKWIFFTLFGVALTLIAILTLYIFDRVIWHHVPFRFSDIAGDSLFGDYYSGKLDGGVILLEGFGSDQITLWRVARGFAQLGYHIFTFDFSGHGRSPGTQGCWPFVHPTNRDRSGIWKAFDLTTLMLIITAVYARTGWFHVFPLNTRLLWLVFFSLPTALGFWIGIYEIGMIAQIAPDKLAPQAGALLIGILPFFLYTAFWAGIDSLSGVISRLQGLLILALALIFGYLLRQANRFNWINAICQAVLLYWLILPQGVLFG